MKTYKHNGLILTVEGSWFELSDGYSVISCGSCSHDVNIIKLYNQCVNEYKQEIDKKTQGYTSVSFDKVIVVIDNNNVYNLSYYELDKLPKYIDASIPEGQFMKRINQLKRLGYDIVEILWRGQEKHFDSRVLLAK